MLLPLCLLGAAAFGQDIILKSNGEEVVGKVLHVGPNEVMYRYFNDAENKQTFYVSRQEIAEMRLMASANPMDVAEVVYVDEVTSIKSAEGLIAQAQRDAKAYYKGRGVMWATLGTTILNPAAGLVTGTVSSIIPPNLNADYNPNRHLMKEPAYLQAYQKQAQKVRIKKATAGFGAGVLVLSAIYMVVASVGGGG